MPYEDPEPYDPQELVGVDLPGDESVTRDMAAAFADEFAQLGFTRDGLLALYRRPEYAGAHRAWRLLGEDEVARIVDESLAVWGRFGCVVTDAPDPQDGPDSQLVQLLPRRD
jgi:3-mercaptopyruvate sulfurtransferase SseA